MRWRLWKLKRYAAWMRCALMMSGCSLGGGVMCLLGNGVRLFGKPSGLWV